MTTDFNAQVTKENEKDGVVGLLRAPKKKVERITYLEIS